MPLIEPTPRVLLIGTANCVHQCRRPGQRHSYGQITRPTLSRTNIEMGGLRHRPAVASDEAGPAVVLSFVIHKHSPQIQRRQLKTFINQEIPTTNASRSRNIPNPQNPRLQHRKAARHAREQQAGSHPNSRLKRLLRVLTSISRTASAAASGSGTWSRTGSSPACTQRSRNGSSTPRRTPVPPVPSGGSRTRTRQTA